LDLDVVKVPFVDLGPYVELVGGDPRAFGEDVLAEVLISRDFIGSPTSPTVQAFETKLAAKLGANHVVACANGTDALQLALRASGIGPGSRVAMPNLTFFATYEAIVNVGATPVLLDIDRDDRQLSYEALVAAHDRRRFDAVVLVHLYGWCSKRLDDFRTFCRERRIPLIEDGAQAFGVKFDDQSVFADADIATLSFYPAKVLGGIGDGGAVVCKTERLAQSVRLFANHGRTGHYRHATVGWNSRMDSIQALWLTRALDVIDGVLDARRKITRLYGARMDGRVLGNGYLDVRSVAESAFMARMADRGIETGRIYPSTIDQQRGADRAIRSGDLHVSQDHVRHCVSLPVWYGMTDEMVDYVLEAVRG
jgi:UDP-2-acetamido-2-deoxy-ribo-hexuluronate aminotransferase